MFPPLAQCTTQCARASTRVGGVAVGPVRLVPFQVLFSFRVVELKEHSWR